LFLCLASAALLRRTSAASRLWVSVIQGGIRLPVDGSSRSPEAQTGE
jgi:hypothetical protein